MTEQSVRGRIADVCAWCLYDNEHKTMFDPATVATDRIIAIVREAMLSEPAVDAAADQMDAMFGESYSLSAARDVISAAWDTVFSVEGGIEQ